MWVVVIYLSAGGPVVGLVGGAAPDQAACVAQGEALAWQVAAALPGVVVGYACRPAGVAA